MALSAGAERFPNRLILQNPFFYNSLVSYGLVGYCIETNRWLCVKRYRSAGYILCMRGSYRLAEIGTLVADLSIEEHKIFSDILSTEDCRKYNNYYLHDFYVKNEISNSVKATMDYARYRFSIYRNYFLRAITAINPQSDNEWMWPKGRLNPNEIPINCAIREFYEETGIDLRCISRNEYTILKPQLSETFRGLTGRQYDTKFWILLLNKEIKPPEITRPGEIGQRKWFTEDEAKIHLSASKYEVLRDSKKIIQEYPTVK